MSRRGAETKKPGRGQAASPPEPQGINPALEASDWALYQPARHPRRLALVVALELVWIGFLLWMAA